MEGILERVPDLVEVVALGLMALVILATVIVRITPSDADDVAVGRVTSWIVKAIAWLPTIGLNPRTKKLEEAYKELKELKK